MNSINLLSFFWRRHSSLQLRISGTISSSSKVLLSLNRLYTYVELAWYFDIIRIIESSRFARKFAQVLLSATRTPYVTRHNFVRALPKNYEFHFGRLMLT